MANQMKNYECLLNIANPNHFLSQINSDGSISEIKATKFKFKGEIKVKERFLIEIPASDQGIEEDIQFYDHSFEIYETPNYTVLIKSISGKNKNNEMIPSEKSFSINILIIPSEFTITFNMLHDFYVYNAIPESYRYVLQLAKNFNIDTEYKLEVDS